MQACGHVVIEGYVTHAAAAPGLEVTCSLYVDAYFGRMVQALHVSNTRRLCQCMCAHPRTHMPKAAVDGALEQHVGTLQVTCTRGSSTHNHKTDETLA
jgi:hypothetical protein